jgi:hypothetical protein
VRLIVLHVRRAKTRTGCTRAVLMRFVRVQCRVKRRSCFARNARVTEAHAASQQLAQHSLKVKPE